MSAKDENGRNIPSLHHGHPTLEEAYAVAVRGAMVALSRVYDLATHGDIPVKVDLAALDDAYITLVDSIDVSAGREVFRSLREAAMANTPEQLGWGLPTPHFLETRADGLPWTKEGCNERRGGKFVPWDSRCLAQAELDRRREGRDEFDDPMWKTAEYRLVPVRKRP